MWFVYSADSHKAYQLGISSVLVDIDSFVSDVQQRQTCSNFAFELADAKEKQTRI
jgi:hypothetical protein